MSEGFYYILQSPSYKRNIQSLHLLFDYAYLKCPYDLHSLFPPVPTFTARILHGRCKESNYPIIHIIPRLKWRYYSENIFPVFWKFTPVNASLTK